MIIQETSTFGSLNLPILNYFNMSLDTTCFYENNTSYYSAAYLIEYFNSNLFECCQICSVNHYCISWTLFPVRNSNYTCRLFDSFRPGPSEVAGHQSGFNQKSTSNTILLLIILIRWLYLKIHIHFFFLSLIKIAFGFYSANDQYQARFFNLEGNYTFLNRQPVYRREDQDFLTIIVKNLEINVIRTNRFMLQTIAIKIS